MWGGVPGQGSLRKISSVGVVSPWSLKSYGSGAVFVGIKDGVIGIYYYMGGDQIECISNHISNELNSNIGKAYALPSSPSLSCVQGEINGNEYTVSVTPSATYTYNRRHYVFYLDRIQRDYLGRLIAPCVRGDRGMNAIKTVTVAGEDYLMSGSPTSGYVYKEFNGTSDDTTDNIYADTALISAYVKSKAYDFGSPYLKEIVRSYVRANALGAWSLNFTIFKDFETYGSDDYPITLSNEVLTWADVVFLVTPWQTAKSQNYDEVVFNYPSKANHFQFGWANSNATEYFTVFNQRLVFKEEAR
jgi:hypothetical protein